MVSSLANRTYLWVTLEYASAVITPRTLSSIQSMLVAVKLHAEEFWNFDKDFED